MEVDSVFTGLSLVIVLGAAVAFIMRLIGQPLIIGHIITGILVGPSVLHLIHSPETFATFSDIGIALLLFIIGLGLNPQVINELGKVTSLTGILGVIGTTVLGSAIGLILGLDQTEALFLGIGLSFSSTIIILKLLNDKREQARLYGKITIGITLVEDMLAAVALLFLIAKGEGSAFSIGSVAFLATKGIAVGYVMYLISSKLLPKMQRMVAGSPEFLFLFAISWGFGSAALFEAIGFSNEVGALFAGILLASLPYVQEISSRLRPLRDFFIILFFITLGAALNFDTIAGLVPLIIAGVITVALFKPLIILLIISILGYTKRTSFKTAFTMGQVSEFGIIFIVLGVQQGLIDTSLAAAITMIALITIAISTYVIVYIDRIYDVAESALGLFERKHTHAEEEYQQHYDLILLGYQKGGHEFVNAFKQLGRPYVVVDYDPEMIDPLEHHKINFLYGDASNIELLEEAGVKDAKLIVSTISDHETTRILLQYLAHNNPEAVVICLSDQPEKAIELYRHGASYVMLPHYIGSEKLSHFIRQVGYKKSEFRKIRSKHLQYLEAQLSLMEREQSAERSFGHVILNNLPGFGPKD